MATTQASSSADLRSTIAARYSAVRDLGLALCRPLSAEDCVVQSMPEVSPTRWHLAHTTWFFERFVLAEANGDYRPFDPVYERLFNSYYNAVGEPFPRARRGLLSRPGLAEVLDYRAAVDERICQWIDGASEEELSRFAAVIDLGLNHEQQHQELMLTDIKHVFSCNPLLPAYLSAAEHPSPPAAEIVWTAFDEGIYKIGHDSCSGRFAYDNECPRHRVFLEAFELADRLVTNGEFLEFIEQGGYRDPAHWLSAGWNEVQQQGWQAPLYWHRRDGAWWEFTLAGLVPLDPHAPLCHVSYFEADAFARFSGARLPTEAEWEVAAENMVPGTGQGAAFLDASLDATRQISADRAIHPQGMDDRSGGGLRQMFGSVWQWTASQYLPYPGFRIAEGALGEYNGKFMCNQFVLRGGSVASSADHLRATYRNFFPPEARWQFSGVRLAR